MSETKFTPGPWVDDLESDWTIDTGGENSFVHIGREGCNPVDIAIVPSALGMDSVLDANAHLIAAAPELYVELDMQAKNCPLCKGTGKAVHGYELMTQDDPVPTDCQRCKGAREALAKARGESQ